MADEYIQFISSVNDFKEDKKLPFKLKTNDLDIFKYYISIQTPINKYVGVLLEKILDVKKLEKSNLALFSMNETSFLKELNSSKFKRQVNELLTEYKKAKKKALFHACKVYILEKYFSKKNAFPSFHKM